MRKYFCDGCKNEIKNTRDINKFEYLVHIANFDAGGYIDRDGNAVSGRTEGVELCNKCYNAVMIEAYKKFQSIKKGAT